MDDLIREHIALGNTIPAENLMERSISYLEGERKLHEHSDLDPIDYLKKIMEERHLKNKDLKAYIGSSGHVCSVLKKKKPLSLRMIRNLNRYLDIPAEILIQPYNCH
jgi:HTH-type transcriptional regulator/antitoxin HigA